MIGKRQAIKETMVSLTIFNSIYDNKTHQRMDYDSFDEFVAVLCKLSKSDKYKNKKDAPLISQPYIQRTLLDVMTV